MSKVHFEGVPCGATPPGGGKDVIFTTREGVQDLPPGGESVIIVSLETLEGLQRGTIKPESIWKPKPLKQTGNWSKVTCKNCLKLRG